MREKTLKIRLGAMSLLVFGVWGCYLVSLGNFLNHCGLGRVIGWFYASQCVISLFTPAAVGFLSDCRLGARRTLGACAVATSLFIGAAALYALRADAVGFLPLFVLFVLGTASFLPMVGLSNSIIFSELRAASLDPRSNFPPIRICGTVGFIAGMLAVNFAGWQSSAMQLVLAAVVSLCLAAYSVVLPSAGLSMNPNTPRLSWLSALSMFRNRETAVFFGFCILVGVDLQVTNSFGNVYISMFGSMPQFAGTWGASNANAIIAVSQVSEALCILLMPFCLRRFGIRPVMLIAITAWSLRFLLLGVGDTGSGLWLLIASGVVYGVAFDFFNIAGNVYVDSHCDPSMRAGAQGLFMAMSSGVGGTLGLIAAQGIANGMVFSAVTPGARHEGWVTFWLTFAAYAFVTAVLFAIWMKFSSASGASKPERKRSSSDADTN